MAAMLAGALSATACTAGTAAPHQPPAHQAAPASVAPPQVPASGRGQTPSALDNPAAVGLSSAEGVCPRPLAGTCGGATLVGDAW